MTYISVRNLNCRSMRTILPGHLICKISVSNFRCLRCMLHEQYNKGKRFILIINICRKLIFTLAACKCANFRISPYSSGLRPLDTQYMFIIYFTTGSSLFPGHHAIWGQFLTPHVFGELKKHHHISICHLWAGVVLNMPTVFRNTLGIFNNPTIPRLK